MDEKKIVDKINKILGNTWFDLEIDERSKSAGLVSRCYGSIGNEEVGHEDVVEGERICKLLKTVFPDAEVSHVDEWVSIDFDLSPILAGIEQTSEIFKPEDEASAYRDECQSGLKKL